MLQRLSLEDDAAPLPSGASASTMSSTSTGNSSYVSSVSLDKLDLPAGAPAMSTVFPSSSDSGSEKRDGRRSDSPRGGKDHRGSFSFHLPHRRSTSRASSADRGISTSSVSTTQQKKMDIMARWLRDGNVIYKSVGLGLMDLVVGREVVEMARQKHIGTHVEHF